MKVPHERNGADLRGGYFMFLVVFAVRGVHKELRGPDQNFNHPPSNRVSVSLSICKMTPFYQCEKLNGYKA